jgi:hypothetical protein
MALRTSAWLGPLGLVFAIFSEPVGVWQGVAPKSVA